MQEKAEWRASEGNPDPQSSLKDLVTLSQEGDDDAFGQIYDRLAEPVYKFIYVRVRHKESAEDLLSISFLKIWQNIDTYKQQKNAKFTTWMFKICINVINDHMRKKKPEVNLEDYMNSMSQPNQLDEAIDTRMRFKKIQNLLHTLADDYQNILTLRFINQLSIEETAQAMGRSNGAVRVLQTRALRKLKEQVEK